MQEQPFTCVARCRQDGIGGESEQKIGRLHRYDSRDGSSVSIESKLFEQLDRGVGPPSFDSCQTRWNRR